MPQRPPVSGGAGRPLVVGAGSSGNATGVKIEVMQAGSVSVSFADLVAQGMPASVAATPDAVRLTNLGQPVSFQQRPDQSGTPRMTFQADTLSTDYTGSNVYVVSWGPSAPPAPAASFTRSGFPVAKGMLRIERHTGRMDQPAEGRST